MTLSPWHPPPGNLVGGLIEVQTADVSQLPGFQGVSSLPELGKVTVHVAAGEDDSLSLAGFDHLVRLPEARGYGLLAVN